MEDKERQYKQDVFMQQNFNTEQAFLKEIKEIFHKKGLSISDNEIAASIKGFECDVEVFLFFKSSCKEIYEFLKKNLKNYTFIEPKPLDPHPVFSIQFPTDKKRFLKEIEDLIGSTHISDIISEKQSLKESNESDLLTESDEHKPLRKSNEPPNNITLNRFFIAFFVLGVGYTLAGGVMSFFDEKSVFSGKTLWSDLFLIGIFISIVSALGWRINKCSSSNEPHSTNSSEENIHRSEKNNNDIKEEDPNKPKTNPEEKYPDISPSSS